MNESTGALEKVRACELVRGSLARVARLRSAAQRAAEEAIGEAAIGEAPQDGPKSSSKQLGQGSLSTIVQARTSAEQRAVASTARRLR